MTKKNAHNTDLHVSGARSPHVPYSTLRYGLRSRGGARDSSGFGFGGGFGFGAESNKPLSVKSTRRPLNGILIAHPAHIHTYIRMYTTNGTDAKRFFIIFCFFYLDVLFGRVTEMGDKKRPPPQPPLHLAWP